MKLTFLLVCILFCSAAARADQPISGQVLDAQKRPVAGALVLAAQNATFSPVETDGQGRFDLKALPDGSVTLFAARGRAFARLENAREGAQITLQEVPVPPQDKARAAQLLKEFSLGKFGWVLQESGLSDPQWFLDHTLTQGDKPHNFGIFCKLLLRMSADDKAEQARLLDLCWEKRAAFPEPQDQFLAVMDWFDWVVKIKPAAAREWLKSQSAFLIPAPDNTENQSLTLLRALLVASYAPELGLDAEAVNARQFALLMGDRTTISQTWWVWQIAAPWLARGGVAQLEAFLAEADFDQARTFQLLVEVVPVLAMRDFESAQKLWQRLIELRESPAVRAYDESEKVKNGRELSSSELMGFKAPDYALALSRRDVDAALELASQFAPKWATLVAGAIARDLIRRGEKERGLALFAATTQNSASVIGMARVCQVWAQYEPEKAYATMLQTLKMAPHDSKKQFPADFALPIAPAHPDWGRLALEWKWARALGELQTLKPDKPAADDLHTQLAFVAGAMAGYDLQRAQELAAQLALMPDASDYLEWAMALQTNMALLTPPQRAQAPFGLYRSEGLLD